MPGGLLPEHLGDRLEGAEAGAVVVARRLRERVAGVAEGLNPRPERRRAASVPAPPPEDARSARLGTAGKLVAEAGLAAAGRARDDEQTSAARERVRQPGLEQR